LAQQVVRSELACDRVELALRKTKFFCKEFALRHRLPGSLKRLGDVLEGE